MSRDWISSATLFSGEEILSISNLNSCEGSPLLFPLNKQNKTKNTRSANLKYTADYPLNWNPLMINHITVLTSIPSKRFRITPNRITQREYSWKPLKHSIVERILVFEPGRYRHIFILKIFHLFGFPSWKSSDPKIMGIKTYLFENFSHKKAPENSSWPF